jgi:hypothetical protein
MDGIETKEKPIIFSTPMVKAILAGNKTMTRRVVKEAPCTDNNGCVNIKGLWVIPERDKDHAFDGIAPYCVGDHLWVRETWCKQFENTGSKIEYFANWSTKNKKTMDTLNPYGFECPKWRPSIFLSRLAARIFMEVKHVRLEQLQSISERDAVKEGITTLSFVLPDEKTKIKPKGGTFRTEFKHLWDKLNAKRGYGWDINPWVWVIQFERIKP